MHNDLGGGVPPASTYFECAAQGQIPGDCGEGIHLLSVAQSTVRANFISGNSGGVLLTDETGPTDHNVVENNLITKNATDCGITLPGHNPNALSTSGHLQPSVAGVYDNVIRNNKVTDNGLKGEGAGVLFANAGPGTASYNNLVEGNYIAGNELAGVTLHAHTLGPGQFEDLSGNTVVQQRHRHEQHRRRPARLARLAGGSADDWHPRVLRRHARRNHDRSQCHFRQRDRHLAEQAGDCKGPAHQFVLRRGDEDLSRQLSWRSRT